jgi:hypothetical protein
MLSVRLQLLVHPSLDEHLSREPDPIKLENEALILYLAMSHFVTVTPTIPESSASRTA